MFTVRSRDERLEGSSFPVGSIAAQLPSPTTDRIPPSVASERTGWTADHVLYRGRTVVLKVKVSPDLIAGDVDEGYGKVADVFRRNMTSGQEVGAAVAVYRDGVKVVDLWGGLPQRDHQGAAGARHPGPDVLDDEGYVRARGGRRRLSGTDFL